jgi:dihydrolipoamide dehydrogenase
MMPDPFDLLVIGAGPGGYTAAIRAAQLGMRVGCIEKDETLGGTCLNVGCIPSKALLDSSEHYYHLRHGIAAHGIKVGGVELDLPAMMARKDKVVKTLTTGIKGLFRKNKVEHIVGAARLAAGGGVTVGGNQQLQADNILIASGSVPIGLKDLPFDGKHIVSSTEALALPQVPGELLVIGGGAIGLELGSVWNRLGSKVEVIELMDRIVPGTDVGMGKQLQRSLEKQGMTFQLRTSAASAKVEKGRVRVALKSGEQAGERVCDIVLVAVGRRAYTEELGLLEAGVQTDDRGRIKVDAHYRTNVAGVWAIGDAIAGPMLAHKAEEEGIAAVERMAGQAGHVNYDAVPSVVYTWPELASVGMSEEGARERGEVNVGSFPFMASARARCMEEKEGLVKVVADARTDRVLGVHILGPRASDLIAEAAVAIEFGASSEDIARSVHAHPTLPEAIREAALAVQKRAIQI